MFYRPEFYNGRHFSKTIEYADIDFTDMASIIPAFKERLADWYIVPAQSLAAHWHNAFSVAALDCLLIDTLAQFEQNKSGKRVFIDFVKTKFPVFGNPLPSPIARPSPGKPITTPAEALYFGFRCGILHEAHIPPYGQILPEPAIVRTEASGITTYADGTDCVSVVLDPIKLFDALKVVFQEYIANLLNSNSMYDQLRVNFKDKFTASFGIDVMGAT